MPSRAFTTVDVRRFTGTRNFCAAVAFALLVTGCSNQINNPWKDSSEVVDAQLTTPNQEIYADKQPTAIQHRAGTPSDFTYATGETTHWPEWFADPFNDLGNDHCCGKADPGDREVIDTRFAVNACDYGHIAYGPARMLLNIVGFPVSAVVDYPGKLQASDARLSPQTFGHVDHDHRKVESGEVDPPDVVTVHETLREIPCEADDRTNQH